MNRYPLWKYIVLIIFVVFGLLYALPNFFGEVPVLQITGSEGAPVTANTLTTVRSTLQQANLPFQSMQQKANGLLVVHFASVAEQLKAKAAVQTRLGNNYVVAQNLLGMTPKWLKALGAQPMKLGLDLRGGMHFLLQVDVDAVIKKQQQENIHQFAKTLRTANLRYAGIRLEKNGALLIKFRSDKVRNQAQSKLQREYPGYVITDLTQGQELYLQVSMSPVALANSRKYTMSQTITVLRNRIDALGVAEPHISQQGLDRIVVELPGVQDMALAKQMLGGNATLEFHLVDAQHDLQSAVNGMVPMGSTLYHMSDGSPILLKNQSVLSGKSISFASAGFDQTGQPAVNLKLSGSEVSNFSRVTADNVGQRLAIVYVDVKKIPKVVNGKTVYVAHTIKRVISAPVIQSALGNSFQINHMNSTQEAQKLAILLKSGASPAVTYPIQEKTVGPSLGASNIKRGIISVITGFVLIVVFMAVYYRIMGLIADLALLLNVVFIVAIMSLIGVTLTLPGIAGIVLTMGMAVDANVLIFERIREELHNGSSIQAAIHAGYARAFATIVDANVTTLIVAVALFAIGSGAIQGFAVTLIVGLLTSMVTAIMGTRGIVNLLYGNKPVKKLSIGMK